MTTTADRSAVLNLQAAIDRVADAANNAHCLAYGLACGASGATLREMTAATATATTGLVDAVQWEDGDNRAAAAMVATVRDGLAAARAAAIRAADAAGRYIYAAGTCVGTADADSTTAYATAAAAYGVVVDIDRAAIAATRLAATV